MANQLTKAEGNVTRNLTDVIIKKVLRHRSNYALKATLTGIFLFSLCKSTENYNILKLKRRSNFNDMLQAYSSTFTSFGFMSAALILI